MRSDATPPPPAGVFVQRRASIGDVALLRNLRIRALTDAPEQFGSTLERERSRSDAEWVAWLADGATFLAERSGTAIGLAAGVPHWTDPTAVFLMSMWVEPEHRGTGVADALVRAVIQWAEGTTAMVVLLHVVKDNERARRCYERHGFLVTGEEDCPSAEGRCHAKPSLAMARRIGERRPTS